MPPVLRRLALALLALLFLAQPGPAMAWSWYGHETVAQIAMANVTPATRAAVMGLLQKEALLETPKCSARTLERASTWADCVRRDDAFKYSGPWHQQDVDVCVPFDLTAPCKDGNCVSAQIVKQAQLLKDKSLPERDRLVALIFLIHFVGDLHQPLHAADRAADGGGNGVVASYGIAHGAQINLHKIWDNYLAERAISTPGSLVHAYSAADKARYSAGTVEDWSRESWELARSAAYEPALGPDYCKQPRKAHGALSEAQIEALIPTVREQIVRGGLRLARLLDEAFAEPKG